ncbi:MAG: N-acyl homoserine lactonase family protein [Chitinophagaceae bacterium]|nr:N-acyl homoserine lactonase family protein [Anaerolineae bacterium]
MKIHAIQTGIVQVKTAFLSGSAKAGGLVPFLFQLHREYPYVDLPIYAWVIEHPEGVIVVDTGDTYSTKTTWLIQTRRIVAPEHEIGAQLKQLGIGKKDIAKVVLTHIHGDHANGLKYFPDAPIWISAGEYKNLHSVAGRILNRMTVELPTGFAPQPITMQPAPFGAFAAHFPLTQSGDVIAVPTPGHTPGHISVIAISEGKHYFLAGDVTYDEAGLIHQEMQGPTAAPTKQPDTLARVLQYTQANPTVYLPSHDLASGQRLTDQQIVPQTLTTTK